MNNKSLFLIKPELYDNYLYKHNLTKFLNRKKYKLVYLYGNLLELEYKMGNYNFKKINTLDPNFWYPIENIQNNILLIVNRKLIDYSFLLDLLNFSFPIDIIFILEKPNKSSLDFLTSDIFNWTYQVDLKVHKIESSSEIDIYYDFLYD